MTTEMQGSTRTYDVRTYGCQMNVHDSERISGLMEDAGYVRAADPDAALGQMLDAPGEVEEIGVLRRAWRHLPPRRDGREEHRGPRLRTTNQFVDFGRGYAMRDLGHNWSFQREWWWSGPSAGPGR